MSRRKAINLNCKSCAYDDLAASTWRHQVTLCSVKSCALYDVRPKSTRPSPESVLSYYEASLGEYLGKEAL